MIPHPKADPSIQEQLFKEFITWLDEASKSWEILAATRTGVKTGGRGNFFTVGDMNMQCYGCRETSHFKKDCGKRGQNQGQNGGNSGGGFNYRKLREASK